MPDNDIQFLREQVKKRRAAVTAKENRIRRNTGVEIAGTPEDPRRPPSVIAKYNARQLNNYLGDLNSFMSRGNGYIADASGGFIRKSSWLAYKRVERANNALAKAEFESFADVHDPVRNMTVREAEVLFTPDSKRAQGDIRHRPYSVVDRKPENIKNAAALDKLKKQLDGKLAPGYLPKAIKASRRQAGMMMDNAGVSDLKKVMAKLSDSQFNLLWNYTGFAGRLAQIGESGGHRSKTVRDEEKHDPMSSQEKNSIREDIKNILTEAHKIPGIDVQTGKKGSLERELTRKRYVPGLGHGQKSVVGEEGSAAKELTRKRYTNNLKGEDRGKRGK